MPNIKFILDNIHLHSSFDISIFLENVVSMHLFFLNNQHDQFQVPSTSLSQKAQFLNVYSVKESVIYSKNSWQYSCQNFCRKFHGFYFTMSVNICILNKTTVLHFNYIMLTVPTNLLFIKFLECIPFLFPL